MAPKIFITGATGYIGGDALYALYQAHPDYDYTALVRTEEKANVVKKAFPNVKTVIGDLDNSKLLEEEASKADVVIHTADASDHAPAARALAAGLASTHSKERPGFWLHTSGTGILCWEDTRNNSLGAASSTVYDDWASVDALTSLPDDAFHRDVDKIVLEAGTKHAASVKTAIVCPPTIYGAGRGPGNARSRQAYELAKVVLREGYVPIIGEGKARWNYVHVADLADVFVRLTEKAVQRDVDPELWGDRGYYLVEGGEHVWSELARAMGRKALELEFLKGEVREQQLSKDEAMERAGFEAVSWGLNSRGEAERAGKLLGWKASRPGIMESVEEILRDEKARLGQ